MAKNNEESQLINECVTNLLSNQDDFLWVNFTKPCGYSFMCPFQRNDSIQALYRHLDNLWVGNQHVIWFQRNDMMLLYLNRSEQLSIRDFLLRNNICRANHKMSYHVYFDSQPAPQPPQPPHCHVVYANNNNNHNVPWALREMQLPRVCACHPPNQPNQ